MKDTLIEIKNNLQGNNSRVEEAKNQINDLEQKEAKNNQAEQQEGNRVQRNEENVSSLRDNFKRSNIHLIGVPEGEQEIVNLFEKIVKENFPNLVKEVDIQVLEAQRIPIKMHAERPIPRHITIKIPKFKNKGRILKAAREKKLVTYRRVPVGTPCQADFSKETVG